MGYASDVPLFDHHCHGLIQGKLDLESFAALATEGDWLPEPITQVFDSPFGLAMRSVCAPLLGLDPNSSVDEYVTERLRRPFVEVAAPLLQASGTAEYGIETGFPSSTIASPQEMAKIAGRTAHTIVRLEVIAETVAPTVPASGFFDAFCAALDRAMAAGAIGVKTIAAYRFGLDVPAAAPEPTALLSAVDGWYRIAEASGNFRVTDRTVIGALIWAAIDRKLAIQLHVGFGDTDVQLDTADPSRLAPLFRATADSGARFALLHCYPFLREAGILAHVFPHVYFDMSCVSHYAGPSAVKLVAESFEVAPFSRILYASDAYGIPEHYAVSAALWRTGMNRLLDTWVSDGFTTPTDANRIAAAVGQLNAHTLYKL